MKPGKPIVYGRVGQADFIGLPGNPVSAFVTFCLFVRPFLLKRMGVAQVLYRAFPVQAGFAWSKPGDAPRIPARANPGGRPRGDVSQPEFRRADLVRLGRWPDRYRRRPDRAAGRLGAFHSLFGVAAMSLRVLYFARLRERFGMAEETLDFDGATACRSDRAAAGARRRVGRRTGGGAGVPGGGQSGHRRARCGDSGSRPKWRFFRR